PGEHVTYVPVDFERDDLRAALTGAGFNAGAPAVFVWEGVTNYLTARAVDDTLAVIRALAAPGTRLVITYVDARALREPSPFPGATDPAAALRRFLDNFFDWVVDPAEARRRRVTVYVWAHAQHNERLRSIVTEGLAPLQDAAHALTSEQWARLLGPGVDPAAFL